MKDSFVLHTFKFLIIILVGCSNSCVNSDKTSIHYSTLNNKELEKQIINYMHFIDSVGTGHEEYIIRLSLNKATVIYKDSREHLGVKFKYHDNVDIWYQDFQNNDAHDSTMNYDFVIRVNNKDVIVDCNQSLMSYKSFSPNKHEVIQLIKRNFPKQYKEFIEIYRGQSTGSTIDDGNIECHLSYYEGRLFRKEIRRFQDVLFYKEYGENPLKPK
jgi:hypothetical protein